MQTRATAGQYIGALWLAWSAVIYVVTGETHKALGGWLIVGAGALAIATWWIIERQRYAHRKRTARAPLVPPKA